MMRLPDWTVRYQNVITEWSTAPFEYGRHDCALWGAAVVEALTGVDLADGLRGYTTEAEGLAMVRALGFDDHTEVFTKQLPVTDRIRVGDLCIVERDNRVAIGAAQARGIYLMLPDRGLALVPRSWAKTGVAV